MIYKLIYNEWKKYGNLDLIYYGLIHLYYAMRGLFGNYNFREVTR